MPRAWHAACQTGSKTLVHGGRTRDSSENTKRRLAHVVEMFDEYTESWQQKEVTGEAPASGVYTAASASVDDDLFTFGGFDGSRWFNALHVLKRATQWIELCPQNDRAESPMAKFGAGMVAFGNNLAVFGGFGIPHGPTQPGSSFLRDTRYTDGSGWTNEFHIYNLEDGMYIWMPCFQHMYFHTTNISTHSHLYPITNVCSTYCSSHCSFSSVYLKVTIFYRYIFLVIWGLLFIFVHERDDQSFNYSL